MTPTKKKILFVNGHLNVGGIEKSLVDLLKNFDYEAYDVDLLLLEALGSYVEQLPKQVNIIFRDPAHSYGPLLKTLLSNILHLRWRDIVFRLAFFFAPRLGLWILKVLSPVLHITKQYDCAIAYRVGPPNEIVSCTVKAKKKICWWHNGECNYNEKQIQHIRELWKNMDAIVAVSHGCKQMIVEKFAIDDKKVHVIPNIIDIDNIQQMAGDVNPYSDHASIRIVTLGRLCREKHIEDIPDIALNLIKEGISNFIWYIIGEGVMRETITNKIKDYDLTDFVIMLGRKDNPYPYLKFADMMVHTSYVEAHCLTLLEAMALKTPCVATKTVIPQDFTEDGVNCLLAEQEINDQTKSILKMITQKNNQEMIENAYHTVLNSYSYVNLIPSFELVLVETI